MCVMAEKNERKHTKKGTYHEFKNEKSKIRRIFKLSRFIINVFLFVHSRLFFNYKYKYDHFLFYFWNKIRSFSNKRINTYFIFFVRIQQMNRNWASNLLFFILTYLKENSRWFNLFTIRQQNHMEKWNGNESISSKSSNCKSR